MKLKEALIGSTILYKSFPSNMSPNNYKFTTNKWHKIKGKLKACHNGFHVYENIIDAMNYTHRNILAKVQVKGKSDIQYDEEWWSEMKVVKTYKWTNKDSIDLSMFALGLLFENFGKRKQSKAGKQAQKKISERDWTASERVTKTVYWSATRTAGDAYDNHLTKCHNFVIKRAELQ